MAITKEFGIAEWDKGSLVANNLANFLNTLMKRKMELWQPGTWYAAGTPVVVKSGTIDKVSVYIAQFDHTSEQVFSESIGETTVWVWVLDFGGTGGGGTGGENLATADLTQTDDDRTYFIKNNLRFRSEWNEETGVEGFYNDINFNRFSGITIKQGFGDLFFSQVMLQQNLAALTNSEKIELRISGGLEYIAWDANASFRIDTIKDDDGNAIRGEIHLNNLVIEGDGTPLVLGTDGIIYKKSGGGGSGVNLATSDLNQTNINRVYNIGSGLLDSLIFKAGNIDRETTFTLTAGTSGSGFGLINKTNGGGETYLLTERNGGSVIGNSNESGFNEVYTDTSGITLECSANYGDTNIKLNLNEMGLNITGLVNNVNTFPWIDQTGTMQFLTATEFKQKLGL